MEPIYKEETIKIIVAYCPKCKNLLEEQTDPDVRTLMTYMCTNRNCNYCY